MLRQPDKDELHELDWVTDTKDLAAPISDWSHNFSLELARLNGGIGFDDFHMAANTYAQTLTKAAIDGMLTARDKLTMLPVMVNKEMHPDVLFSKLFITKEDLRAWVEMHCPYLRTRLLGFVLHDDLMKQPEPPSMEVAAPPLPIEPEKKESGLSKREQQIKSIEAEIKTCGYESLSIPTGGKTNLRTICKAKYSSLFGAGNDPFNDAWKSCG